MSIVCKTYVVDIDDTLLKSEKKVCKHCNSVIYFNHKPITEEIKFLNRLRRKGNIIILHTGRNWNQYQLTVRQLKECGILYHELVMGKPQGIYVDADAIKSLKEIEK